MIVFNFSVPGEKDEAYGKEYADKIGVEYHSDHRPFTNWSNWQLISDKLLRIDQNTLDQVKYPRLIFSGDGGSVGMGHVYLSHDLLAAHKTGGIKGAMEYFLSLRRFPDRIFKSRVRKIIRCVIRDSLSQELNELSGVAPGRDFYLFLLRNDQRRHLHHFWEYIDLSRVEFLEPFYDCRLLSVVASAPIEPFIGHRFYYDWLDLFPTDAKSVPWQAYPGHVPCPIEKDDVHISQWDNYKKVQQKTQEETFNKCKTAMFSKVFPYYLLNRFMIYAAIIAYKLNIRDVGYIFDIAYSLYSESSVCSNKESVNC